jgi:FkbM family methyltransferase
MICRNFFAENISSHVESLVVGTGVRWPNLSFAAKSIVVGRRTKVKLYPHLGEFDQAVLFRRKLDYEADVFCWLEREAADHYDAVIEIGANVGVYSVFFDALIKARPGCRLQTVVSFEPSSKAFERLLANLQVNDCNFVLPFRAAVDEASGFRYFFEPKDHLTNGSFLKEFAGKFSDVVKRNVVATHGATDLEFFFQSNQKLLLKVDVEGYEPVLLRALQNIISSYRPDIILEVLADTLSGIESLPWTTTFERYLISSGGLEYHPELTANKQYRDWLLKAT